MNVPEPVNYPSTRWGHPMRDARNEETGKGYFVIDLLNVIALPQGNYEFVSAKDYWIISSTGQDLPGRVQVVARNLDTGEMYSLTDLVA